MNNSFIEDVSIPVVISKMRMAADTNKYSINLSNLQKSVL